MSQHWLWLLPFSSQRTQIGPAIMLKTFQVAGVNTDQQDVRFEIPAIQLPSKVRKKLISFWFYFPWLFCIIGFLAATEAAISTIGQLCMVHMIHRLFQGGGHYILLADVATRACGPKRLDCGRKPIIHCNIFLSLLSVAYRPKQRLRHFVEELRLRYVHELSHLSATDDPQYARVPTGEIKLPDLRLHHRRALVRKTEGQRVFNYACFTGPPRLVKSRWPLMTKGIANMMKCNGPSGKRTG